MKQWKIGILGAGGIAEKMADTLCRLPGVCLYAVAARNEQRARAFSERFGVQKAYGSYQELACDPDVSLIYIATPNNLHREHALLCLNHGKHVLCEKPFTINADEAQELFAAAAEHGLLIAEALWTRYLPLCDRLCTLLRGGAVGEPFLLHASMSALSPLPRLRDPCLGGGVLLDIGVYLLTMDALVFGTNAKCVSSDAVFSPEGVDLQSTLCVRHPGQKMSVLTGTMLAVSDRKAYVYGSEGFLCIDNLNNPELIEVFDRDRRPVSVHRRPKQITGMEYEILSCLRAMEQGKTECPEMPHAETLRILRMMDTIRANWGLRYPCEAQG